MILLNHFEESGVISNNIAGSVTLQDCSMGNINGNLMTVFSKDHKVRLQISIVFV